MKYIERLQAAESDPISSQLSALLIKIEKAARDHLKDVNRSLPGFDIHDFDHSAVVLENMEALSQSKILLFSPVELFILHLSAVLHDIGMSLPEWEINCLKLAEVGSVTDGSPGVPEHLSENATFRDCMSYIKEHKKIIYGDFATVSGYFFSFPDEDSHDEYLARELHSYQRFRYGNSDKLGNGDRDQNEDRSLLLRYEYIRETHHIRTEQYVRNLRHLASSDLGGRWAEQVIIDLSLICKLHCEPILEVETLTHAAQYFKGNSANLQFITILLRIADVMHFSLERAPRSLFAERMIKSEASREHWIVKFASGINCSIEMGSTTRRLSIVYAAFCDEPKVYYFLNDYLDSVDVELANFERLISRLRYDLKLAHQLERYELLLPRSVLRDDIKCDSELFRPAPNLKFTLEQKQIIKLLMGVNLYKDKKLAIRELYQNALDACRVLISKKLQEHGRVTFGIGVQKKGSANKKFLFCQDNGTGMTEEIIENYLLKIGRSYYKSRDFLSENIASTSFEPISQFGIGLLSCFMIGDRLEIVTKAIDSAPICFEIDGPNEYFYYKKVSPVDIEALGNHGTLIKVFLNEESSEEYNDRFFENIRSKAYIEKTLRHAKIVDEWDGNLYPIITDIVGDFPSSVSVEVILEGQTIGIIPRRTANDLSQFSGNEIRLVEDFVEANDFPAADINLGEYFRHRSQLATVSRRFEVGGIEVYWSVTLPTEPFPELSSRLLSANPRRIDHHLLVDGVTVNDSLNKIDIENHIQHIQVNFVRNKPELSIDRQNIVKVPPELARAFSLIPEELCKDVLSAIQIHLESNPAVDTPEILDLILEHIFSKFPFVVQYVFNYPTSPVLSRIRFATWCFDYGSDSSISEFIVETTLRIPRTTFKFNSFDDLQKLALLGKSIEAESIVIDEDNIMVETRPGLWASDQGEYKRRIDRDIVFVCADVWPISLQEYDVHTGLAPFIPKKLFGHLNVEAEGKRLSTRAAAFHRFGNTLTGLTKVSPFQIDSRLGISEEERVFGEPSRSRIRKFGKFKDNIWFPELIGHSWENRPQNTKRDTFIFCFVSPLSLSSSEREELEYYRNSEPNYYRGVNEGWSILFLGNSGQHVIAPGFRKRSDLVALVNPAFWKEYHEYSFSFLDGLGVRE